MTGVAGGTRVASGIRSSRQEEQDRGVPEVSGVLRVSSHVDM